MAFQLFRSKRNIQSNQTLFQLFQEKDEMKSGSINVNQMSEIFRVYKVELNIDRVKTLLDSNGDIKEKDFIDYCVEAKLMDTTKNPDEEKEEKKKRKKEQAKNTILFGFLKKNSSSKEKKLKAELDRVEAAFSKLDKDGDGYIDWEEFKQVASGLDDEEAEIIFSACDISGDKKISLEEFRTIASIKREEVEKAERKFKKDLDKVESAFRKLDQDGDGFIDWEEFKQVSKDLDSEQAKKIFEACDESGDKKISLAEFRNMASMKVE